MAHELVESFYQESTVSLLHEVHVSNLEKGGIQYGLPFVLKNDRIGLEFQPSTLIPSVARELYIKRYTHLQDLEHVSHNIKHIVDSVKELFPLGEKSRVHLSILVGSVPASWWQCGQEAQALNWLMKLLFLDLVRLRRAEYQSTVELSDGKKWEAETEHVFRHWIRRIEAEAMGTGEQGAEVSSS
jgi:hypothetical protein